jgi:cytoskeletal protein CcmA (bactofilin family)
MVTMLRKSTNVKEPSVATPAVTPVSESASAKQTTVIGQHISIEGDIKGQEDLVIEGSVKGSIELENTILQLATRARVEAAIRADNVTISGRLVGNINALGKVEITKEADFTGEIKAKRIAVEDGAYLKAVIELEREAVSNKSGRPDVGYATYQECRE